MILGLDPGPAQSACIVLGPRAVMYRETFSNEMMLKFLRDLAADRGDGMSGAATLVVEQIAAMGMAVGAEVFETCVWSGRFIEAWDAHGGAWDRLKRVPIKLHLCGQARAKDANVRQALIDRFGGRACIKKGGALYGVKGDEWSALAVAVTYYDLHIAAPKTVDVLALEANR